MFDFFGKKREKNTRRERNALVDKKGPILGELCFAAKKVGPATAENIIGIGKELSAFQYCNTAFFANMQRVAMQKNYMSLTRLSGQIMAAPEYSIELVREIYKPDDPRNKYTCSQALKKATAGIAFLETDGENLVSVLRVPGVCFKPVVLKPVQNVFDICETLADLYVKANWEREAAYVVVGVLCTVDGKTAFMYPKDDISYQYMLIGLTELLREQDAATELGCNLENLASASEFIASLRDAVNADREKAEKQVELAKADAAATVLRVAENLSLLQTNESAG